MKAALEYWGVALLGLIVLFTVLSAIRVKFWPEPARSTVHRQDGLYSAANRNDLLQSATDFRAWLNNLALGSRSPGLIDTHVLTLNTLVNRSVPGAVWDERQQRYRVKETERQRLERIPKL